MKLIFICVSCLVILLFLMACKNEKNTSNMAVQELNSTDVTMSEKIIADCIEEHGGTKYMEGMYRFDFRNKSYTFKINDNYFAYTMEHSFNDTIVKDSLTSGAFKRYLNGDELKLSDKEYSRFSNALNSVIYFIALPFKLNDPAVNSTYIGETNIENNKYHVVKVTFDEEGGGKDYDDVFYYWINKNNSRMEFLAYKYHTNNGGLRFRKASNPKIVNGVLFQDYINYKAPVGTPMDQLPKLYENRQLEVLSKIITENINHLNQ